MRPARHSPEADGWRKRTKQPGDEPTKGGEQRKGRSVPGANDRETLSLTHSLSYYNKRPYTFTYFVSNIHLYAHTDGRRMLFYSWVKLYAADFLRRVYFITPRHTHYSSEIALDSQTEAENWNKRRLLREGEVFVLCKSTNVHFYFV